MGTKLDAYLRSHGIKSVVLGRESGYSRNFLLRIRGGRAEPTRKCIAAITAACCRLSGERVRAADLFELDPD
jgi:hypothetical protein